MVHIDNLKWGEITIDGKTYCSDMAIFWDGAIKYITKNHKLTIQEFMLLLPKKPEVLIVGIGINGAMSVDEDVKQVAEDKKIKIFEETSEKAVDIFNAMISDEKRAVAVIHTTC
ncbi:MAG: hypothetical protein ISS36_02270 [Candidatus Aenigmarchaeota archaeon]|nr:hypothetical protein [Candidatus Aenigmarchaeota archaeon]